MTLKLKEISYLHAEALAAGELKHGTLALIEKGTPVIVTASQNHLLDKTTSNVQEVIARGAYVIAIGDNESEKLENISNDYVTLPDSNEILTTLISIIPLQFIAYHVANKNGQSIRYNQETLAKYSYCRINNMDRGYVYVIRQIIYTI